MLGNLIEYQRIPNHPDYHHYPFLDWPTLIRHRQTEMQLAIAQNR